MEKENKIKKIIDNNLQIKRNKKNYLAYNFVCEKKIIIK
jgi:hypothetical protein